MSIWFRVVVVALILSSIAGIAVTVLEISRSGHIDTEHSAAIAELKGRIEAQADLVTEEARDADALERIATALESVTDKIKGCRQ